MNQVKAGLGVAVVDGKIYAIGGYTTSVRGRDGGWVDTLVDTNEYYDPMMDK
jgi:hypothetical protein